MKSNIIKYMFLIFVVAIIGFAVYKIYNKPISTDAENNNQIQEKSSEILTNLRIGIAEFDNINPIITKNKDIINLSTIIYEPLISITQDYKIKLCLAQEYSKIQEKTYIIKLKDKLKWDDGTQLTSNDVKFTIDKLKEGKSTYSNNVKNIKEIEIVDNLTIRINLEKTEPFFEYNLIFPIISSKQFENEEDFYTSRIAPMATGMYKVKSASKDNIELIKNDNWKDAESIQRKITDIKINFYSTMGDAYNSFKIGNIDMICTSNINISDYIGTIGYTKKEYKGRELDFLSFNCKDSLLSRREVRQAICYAIDKNKIISNVYEGEYYVSSFPIDYGTYLYTKQTSLNYNKNKAKEILTEAGWSYKYGKWQKTENYNTKVLNLNIAVDSSNKDRVKVAELIKEQLEDIGIKVNINKVSNSKYKDYIQNKNYDIIITGIYNGYSPDLTYFFGENNIANYENEEMQTLINEVTNIQGQQEVQEKELIEKYNKIIELYEKDIPFICLYRNKSKAIYSMKMVGDFTPNNYTAYYNFEKWYRQ